MTSDFFRKLTVGTSIKKPKANDTKKQIVESDVKVEKVKNKSKKKKETEPLDTEERINVYRKKYKIKVTGGSVPAPLRKFSELGKMGVSQSLLDKLKTLALKKPTPVQKQAIPVLLDGRDAIVAAPTGTGKTFSFLIPLLAKLQEHVDSGVRAVILAPTRELADQICAECRRLSEEIRIFYLNKSIVNSWKATPPTTWPDIIVTTPMRLLKACQDGPLKLDNVKYLVLDEVDRLLDANFLEQMDKVIKLCAGNGQSVQKVIFSATIPTGIEDLARMFLIDPVRVTIGRLASDISKNIDQSLVYCGKEEGKIMAVKQIITGGIQPPVIVFCNSIDRCNELLNCIRSLGIPVDSIHSQRSQSERETIIKRFREGSIWFLITTDLLARGLDFPEVSNVINYDYPEDTASYIHRIGRTGRAGRFGKSVTFYTDDDVKSIKIVVNVMKQSGCDVPDWLAQLINNKSK